MFIGLTNSPAIFQALMNSIFVDFIIAGKVAVYLNNILIFSKDLQEHRCIMHKVLQQLEEQDLALCLEKCKFEQAEMKYLGLVIRQGKVVIDLAKV